MKSLNIIVLQRLLRQSALGGVVHFSDLAIGLLLSYVLILLSCKEKTKTEQNDKLFTEKKITDSLFTYFEKEKKVCDTIFDYLEYKDTSKNEDRLKQYQNLAKRKEKIVNFKQNRLENINLARTYYYVAYYNNELCNFYESKKYYQKALDVVKEWKDTLRAIKYSIAIANPKNELNEFEESKLLVEQNLPLIEVIDDLDETKRKYYNPALQRLSEIAKHEKNFNKAYYYDNLNYTYSIRIKDQEKQADDLLNLGTDCHDLKRYSQAFSYFEKAKSLYIKLYQKEKNNDFCKKLANTHTEIADVHVTLKQWNLGLKNYKKAENYLIQANTRNHRYMTEALTGIGNCYLAQKDTAAAFAAYDQAMKALAPKETVADIVAPSYYLVAALQRLETRKALNKNDLKPVLEDCIYIDSVINQVQQQYTRDESKLNLIASSQDFFEDAIETAVKLYKQNRDVKYFNWALHFCERNKAIILRENLKNNQVKQFAGISDELLQQEDSLKANLAYLQKESFDENNIEIKNKIAEAKVAIEKFEKSLEITYPGYYKLKYDTRVSNETADIQQIISDKTLFLEYFLGKKNIYVLAVSKTGVEAYIEPKSNDFDADFKTFCQAISGNTNMNGFTQNAFKLYHTLLEKPLNELNADKHINRIRIVSDAQLAYLPFEVLTEEIPKGWLKEDKPKYVIQNYAVSYLYSNTFLKPRQNRNYNNKLVALGVNYFENQRKLSPLVDAPKECEEVAELFNAQIYTNKEATVQQFRKMSAQAGILHLAMHARVDTSNFLKSSLEFQDSSLYFADIYSKNFKNCGLVTLSACNTGNGPVQIGEGVMSLAWAFAIANCPSTTAALWNIPSGTTRNVMTRYYEYLKAGEEKDIALQKAKLDYFNADDVVSSKTLPRFWAAPILIGDNSPLFSNSMKYFLYFAAIMSFIGISIFLFRKKVKT